MLISFMFVLVLGAKKASFIARLFLFSCGLGDLSCVEFYHFRVDLLRFEYPEFAADLHGSCRMR